MALVVALFVSGIPGAHLRLAAPIELVAPPVPESVRDRDASVEVTVVASRATARAAPPSVGAGARDEPSLEGEGDAGAGAARAEDGEGDAGAGAARAEDGEGDASPGAVSVRDGGALASPGAGASGAKPGATDATPIEGARVQALAVIDGKVHLAGAGITGADGKALIDGLPRAEHWIVAEAPGRARASTPLALGTVAAEGPRPVLLVLGPEHTLDVEVVSEQGAPIASAEVEVTARDPLPVGARAGADGRAHVDRLSAGPYIVRARAPGLEEVTQRGVAEGATVRITLRRLATVVARVVDASGAPAAGARVQIAGASLWPARSSDTDASGAVKIASLATGAYALRATRGADVSPTELDVAVRGGDVREVVLRLAPGRFVAAHVVDGPAEDAASVASAHLTLVEGGLSPFPIEGVADGAGRARLGPIAPGAATIDARADGFVARGGVPVPEAATEVRLVLARAGTIEGRVVDARGFPIDGATIEIVGTDFEGAPIDDDPRRREFQNAHFMATLRGPAPLIAAGELGVVPGPVPPIPRTAVSFAPPGAGARDPSAPPAEPWVTRDDGTFRAAPVSPGRVRAIARHPQFVEGMSDVVTLASGGTARVEVVLRAGGSLEGRVVDAAGHDVAGARVLVAAARGTLERAAVTGSDGRFAFASLPESVTVTVSTDDAGTPRARLAISVPERGRREVTVTLPERRPGVEVRVVDPSSRPVDAAQVTIASLDPETPLRQTAFTTARGEASLADARGVALRVEVTAPGFAPKVVTTGAAPAVVEVALSRAEAAAGEVRTRRGEPIEGAEVVLYTDLGARRTRTDASGAYRVTGLAPGEGRLRVRAAGFAPASRAAAIGAREGRHDVQLPRVELEAEGIVEGTVVDGRGDPVQGARVALDRVPTWLAVGANPPGVAVTDARGRFRLAELPEGTLALEAFAADAGRTRFEGVRVVSGRTTTGVRIPLHKSDDERAAEPASSGGVAVTLGETDADEVVLVSVVEASAAERAGLAPGDVVDAIDGAKVKTIAEARAKMNGPVNDDVVLQLRRGDRDVTVRVTREPVRR